MNKTVLITGSTEGIGAATALEFAKQNYSVQILGRDKVKGKQMIKQLKAINPEGTHLFFPVDLSAKTTVIHFLDEYVKNQKTLDVLILNAGVHPKKNTLSKDGIDITFSVGYISRYLFAVRLNHLLAASSIGNVLHVNGSVVGKIHFAQLSNPIYNKMISVWQNSIGSALLVANWHSYTNSSVDHVHWNPGIVNTKTVKSQNKVVRILSKIIGMVEPSEAGVLITNFITSNESKSIGASFYVKGKQKKKPRLHSDKKLFDELISFSKAFTGVQLET